MWGNSVYTCVCGGTFTPDLKVRALFSDACRLFVVILTAGHASMNLQAFVRRAKCNSATYVLATAAILYRKLLSSSCGKSILKYSLQNAKSLLEMSFFRAK